MPTETERSRNERSENFNKALEDQRKVSNKNHRAEECNN